MQSLQNTLAGAFSSHARRPDQPADSTPRCQPVRPKGPRRQEIEAQEQAALSRAYLYATEQARRLQRPQAELDAIEREFEQRLAAGPDFTRYRGRSAFGPPPAHGLDGNALARIWARFNTFDRQSHEHRQAGKHRGLITRTCREVFSVLIGLAKGYKALFPSLLCLARMARCSKQSVVTALDMLERLGFITRHRRLKRVMTALGQKVEQDTNGYQLHDANPGGMAVRKPVSVEHRSESNSWAAIVSGCLSYLRTHPETWGAPGVAQSDAYGEPPKAVKF